MSIEYLNGSKGWFNEENELHRIDGPAVEYKNGTKEWFINNRHLDTEEIKNWYRANRLDENIPLNSDQQILFKLKFG